MVQTTDLTLSTRKTDSEASKDCSLTTSDPESGGALVNTLGYCSSEDHLCHLSMFWQTTPQAIPAGHRWAFNETRFHKRTLQQEETCLQWMENQIFVISLYRGVQK